MAKRRKGYAGEKKVDYYLRMLASKFTILHDVCLNVNGQTFQMDNLIITPHAIYIIDVKSYHGSINFDHILKQSIHADGKTERGYMYPITQVELQQYKLQQWLLEQSLPSIPIYHFVAISEPSTSIHVKGDEEAVAKIVGHGEDMPRRILHQEELLTNGPVFQHQQICYAIKNNCVEFDLDVMDIHQLNQSDLQQGVFCPECGYLGIPRTHSGWYCHQCQKKYRNAHMPAIDDYLLLVKPRIRNSECMEWLKVNSRSTITRILQNSDLLYDAKRRWWMK
ncbi:nuclease-related domain-containing protein [Oceanobacillus halophilus]|uniref:nuclease-related domain-containing protein n=1 Tax=Oceanobacillus halophilus TaxID=930130 RepID=UPI0011C382F9|nr:nuclease-related domain-containing protein [Oceanobacillus halophilus]